MKKVTDFIKNLTFQKLLIILVVALVVIILVRIILFPSTTGIPTVPGEQVNAGDKKYVVLDSPTQEEFNQQKSVLGPEYTPIPSGKSLREWDYDQEAKTKEDKDATAPVEGELGP